MATHLGCEEQKTQKKSLDLLFFMHSVLHSPSEPLRFLLS